MQTPIDAAILAEPHSCQQAFTLGLPLLGGWYPSLSPNCLTIAVTEKRTRAELDGFVAAMKGALR